MRRKESEGKNISPCITQYCVVSFDSLLWCNCLIQYHTRSEAQVWCTLRTAASFLSSYMLVVTTKARMNWSEQKNSIFNSVQGKMYIYIPHIRIKKILTVKAGWVYCPSAVRLTKFFCSYCKPLDFLTLFHLSLSVLQVLLQAKLHGKERKKSLSSLWLYQ